jgi:hypothetical protein
MAASQTNCTVKGAGFGYTIKDNSVVCDSSSDTCQGATISGCDTVTCGQRDCTSAIITDSRTVICKGESGCRLATIGTEANPVDRVFCEGPSWTCYQATIFANKTIVCNDNSGAGETLNGVCGFATLETPCLQCIGTNHGCGGGTGCKLGGEPCPEFRYGGQTCDAVCPDGESCPMNKTLPDGSKSSGSYLDPNKTLIGFSVFGMMAMVFLM